MLGAMREALFHEDAVVMGINTGTLGFLSEDFHDTEYLFNYLHDISYGHITIDERMALSANILINDKHVRDILAINEIALACGSIRYPIEVETLINDKFVSKTSGTGVLVAAATGSTAMSLSSGGAIVSPSTNIMQIVPMMAHTLTSRPIITTGRDTISLKAELGCREQIDVYGDGLQRMILNESLGNRIELKIFKSDKKIKIIRPQDWNFFDVLSKKLKW
jgi:NAD+ kinase